MLVLAGLLYFAFFVPLGPHTLYRHVTRIAATDEATELSRAVSGAVTNVYGSLTDRLAELRR